jgi:hypothetical protein
MSREIADTDGADGQKVNDDVYYTLPLPDDCVHWVDSKTSLNNCIDEIVKVCSVTVNFVNSLL